MPSYDYECRNCGHRVEVLHGVNDTGPTACERCGGAMRKLISTPSIVFRGSGWAKKDARDAKPAARAGASGGRSESGGASVGDSGDSSRGGSGDSSRDDSGSKGDSTIKMREGSAGSAGSTAPKESSAGAASTD